MDGNGGGGNGGGAGNAALAGDVSVKVSVPSAAGAVKTGLAVFAPLLASYVTVVSPGSCVQE